MKTIRFFPLILYYSFIFYLSSQPPGKPLPFPFADKIVHFILYIPLGVVGGFAFSKNKMDKKKIAMIALLFAILGIGDEIHQSFIPTRKAEVMDVVMNFAGSMTGFFIYYLKDDSSK